MKRLFLKFGVWGITIICLFIAFRGIEWDDLISHLTTANILLLLLALFLTILSYLLRSFRWKFLFPPDVAISFKDSARVLFLGFFMNNILPARTGEFVRAHLGAKVTKEKRTLVLASIANERLADGLTLSLMFVLFSMGLGDQEYSRAFLYVAIFFAAVSIGVVSAIFFSEQLIRVVNAIHKKLPGKVSEYAMDRFVVFLDGLRPLSSRRSAPKIAFWSVVVWCVELLVYYVIVQAYGAEVSWSGCVLFLVAVNFGSLIPAAPGGIGVIEAVGSAALVAIAVPRELALAMVMTQHVIQYIVVGIPGAFVMLSWKGAIQKIRELEEQDGE